MRKLPISVLVGLLAIAMGCGSNGTSTPSPGGGAGGTSAAGGSGGAAGENGTSSCSLPSCLKTLGANCVESGVCTVQNDTATGSSNTCYANGVKEINVHDAETDDRALTVTKGSSTCFSTAFNGNDVYVGMGSVTVKDASGATWRACAWMTWTTFSRSLARAVRRYLSMSPASRFGQCPD